MRRMNDEEILAQYRGGAEAYHTINEILLELRMMEKGDRVAWLNDRIDERRSICEREAREEEESAATGWTKSLRTQFRISAMETLRALIGGAR